MVNCLYQSTYLQLYRPHLHLHFYRPQTISVHFYLMSHTPSPPACCPSCNVPITPSYLLLLCPIFTQVRYTVQPFFIFLHWYSSESPSFSLPTLIHFLQHIQIAYYCISKLPSLATPCSIPNTRLDIYLSSLISSLNFHLFSTHLCLSLNTPKYYIKTLFYSYCLFHTIHSTEQTVPLDYHYLTHQISIIFCLVHHSPHLH